MLSFQRGALMANFGRVAMDQWYTPDEWAEACVLDLMVEIPDVAGSLFVEPSAGRGAFMWPLEDLDERGSGLRSGSSSSDY